MIYGLSNFSFSICYPCLLLKDGLQRKVNDKEKELLKVRHIQEEVASKIGYG